METKNTIGYSQNKGTVKYLLLENKVQAAILVAQPPTD